MGGRKGERVVRKIEPRPLMKMDRGATETCRPVEMDRKEFKMWPSDQPTEQNVIYADLSFDYKAQKLQRCQQIRRTDANFTAFPHTHLLMNSSYHTT